MARRLIVFAWIVLAVGPAFAADGDVDSSFVAPSVDEAVTALAVQRDGRILVGGAGLVRLDANGAQQALLLAPLSGTRTEAIGVFADGRIAAGGIAGWLAGFVRRFLPSGVPDPAFSLASQPNGDVTAIALQPDGAIVFGGFFGLAGATPRLNLGRYDATGAVDAGFAPQTDATGTVTALATDANGDVLVGGSFTAINGVARDGLARVDRLGNVDPGFVAELGPFARPLAIVLQPDAKILLGGSFSDPSGSAFFGVVRLLPDGSLDPDFAPPPALTGGVRALALQADGRVVVGGGFAGVAGALPAMLARLLPDGAVDPDFDAGLCCSNEEVVNAIAVQADGKLLVGGDFTQVNDAPQRFLARLQNEIRAPGTLSFATWRYLGSEAAGATVLKIVRSDGSLGAVSVDWSIRRIGGGDASADVGPQSGRVHLADGERAKRFALRIQNDASTEAREHFLVRLHDPRGGASLGHPRGAVLGVVDDD